MPDPIERKSLPWALAITKAKGIEPNKYEPTIKIINVIKLQMPFTPLETQ
ncbi:unnamed protein product, partial [marine sediment metagenome]